MYVYMYVCMYGTFVSDPTAQDVRSMYVCMYACMYGTFVCDFTAQDVRSLCVYVQIHVCIYVYLRMNES